MNSKSIIIFDFDGVIADSGDKIYELLNNMAPDFGIARIKDSEMEKVRAMGFRELIKELNVPIYKLPVIVARLRKELAAEIPRLKPIKGISDVLKKLHQKGNRMGIITSNSEENTGLFLKNNKINFFEFINGGNSLFGKDKKIRKIIKDKNLLKDNVLYVGDETRDIEAARKAGVKIVSVCWGFNSEDVLRKHNPDWLLSKPEELLLLSR